MRVLHLATDDKFVDIAMTSFETVAPDLNDVVVCSNKQLEHVKSNANIIDSTAVLSGQTGIQFEKYFVIVVHGLNQVWFPFFRWIPKRIRVVWVGWGYDYYDLIGSDDNFYLPRTKEFLKSRDAGKSVSLQDKVAFFLKGVLKSVLYPSKKTVLKRIDFFAPVLPAEYEKVKVCAPALRAKQIDWNYGGLESSYIKGFEGAMVNGKNILLGNSASYTNNHIDIMYDLLSRKDTLQGNIICPLSYGDSGYGEAIAKLGEEYFGDAFMPLLTFMPMAEYVDLIKSCEFVIMPHLRQQAVGNIITMAYLGARIFLQAQSPTYRYCIDLGLIVNTCQEINEDASLLQFGLTALEKECNRNIILKYWGDSESVRKTEVLLSMVKVSDYE